MDGPVARHVIRSGFLQALGIPKELRGSVSEPAGPAGPWTPIPLAHNPGRNSIGVEPQGGHFSAVLGPQARTPGHYTFSTYGKKQNDSVLAIYATNSSLIPLAKPLARVRLSGLKPGVTEHRIGVEMQLTPEGVLNLSARDLKYHQLLTITPLDARDLREARLQMPAPAGLNQTSPGSRSGLRKRPRPGA